MTVSQSAQTHTSAHIQTYTNIYDNGNRPSKSESEMKIFDDARQGEGVTQQ